MSYKSYYSGVFKPSNPQKYKGDPTNIVYRSSWELKVMRWFDANSNILWWSSEELFIPYLNPIDNRVHRYFPDFLIQMKQKSGNIVTCLIEVKPYNQTQQPEQGKKKKKTFINESIVYTVNQAKWKAADLYCQEKGIIFKILTEQELGIK